MYSSGDLFMARTLYLLFLGLLTLAQPVHAVKEVSPPQPAKDTPHPGRAIIPEMLGFPPLFSPTQPPVVPPVELRALVVAFEKAINKRDWAALVPLFNKELQVAAGKAQSLELFFAPLYPGSNNQCTLDFKILAAQKSTPDEGVIYLLMDRSLCGFEHPVLWTWFVKRENNEWQIASYSDPAFVVEDGGGLWFNGFEDADAADKVPSTPGQN